MSKRKNYSISGSLERNLAAIDALMDKAIQGEEAFCMHDCNFGEYEGAVLYAARTPLDEVEVEEAYNQGFDVARRNTGGSPYIWREDDIVMTATSTEGDILEGLLGLAVRDTLMHYGVKEDRIEIKDDANRRAVWVDGMPISSFGSYNSRSANLLSGFIAATPYDGEAVSNIVELRGGEKEYIDRMPAISDFTEDFQQFSDVLRSKIGMKSREKRVMNRGLEDYLQEYRTGLEEREGGKHKGFCPVFSEDLEEFTEQVLQPSQ